MVLNAAVSAEGGAASGPTVFPELNELLAELVARVESILGDNVVGVYLVGGFALGAGDLQSDCDFIVVIEQRVIGGAGAAASGVPR